MTPKIDPQELLSIWEGIWGKISPDWAVKFLTDYRVKEILTFPDSSIKLAILNHKKLDEIVLYLEEHSPKLEASPKPNNDRIKQLNKRKQSSKVSPQDYSDYEEIYEWLLQMSVASLDPESTFPRLIIKSDKYTCESKVTYIDQENAILTLIELGRRNGELIKQLPYKCNICRKYHNTHLISRETIQKLLRNYKRLLI
jgi:hypothetical protein